MTIEQIDRVSAAPYAQVTPLPADQRWLSASDVEPRLDELLDDPIMALLWRADRMDRATAHATLQRLRAHRAPCLVD